MPKSVKTLSLSGEECACLAAFLLGCTAKHVAKPSRPGAAPDPRPHAVARGRRSGLGCGCALCYRHGFEAHCTVSAARHGAEGPHTTGSRWLVAHRCRTVELEPARGARASAAWVIPVPRARECAVHAQARARRRACQPCPPPPSAARRAGRWLSRGWGEAWMRVWPRIMTEWERTG